MKLKKRYLIIITTLLVIATLTIVGYVLYQNNKDTSITFVKDTIIEYGDTNSDSKKLVEKTSKTIIAYPKIDVMKVGEQVLIYKVKDGNTTKEIPHTITVKDTKGPRIKFKKEIVTIGLQSKEMLVTNIASIEDNVDGRLSFSKQRQKGTYSFSTDLDTSKAGQYQVKVIAIDINGNESTKDFNVIVEEKVSSTSPNEIEPTYINGILLVNKEYGLPRGFGEMDATAYAFLQNLQEEAQKAGYSIPTLSGFRTYDTQVILYNDYVSRDGKEAADRYSARPGFSEHQSGLCFDVGLIDNNYGESDAGKWLQNNCYKFGFIIRYPNGKEDITGYMYEPWHIRYVGEEVATTIMKQQITLEEYLGVYK